MQRKVYIFVEPFEKDLVTLGLEAGIDGVVVADAHLDAVKGLAKCEFIPGSEVEFVYFSCKEDELEYAQTLRSSTKKHILGKGWEIIPVENLLAQPDIAEKVCLEVTNLEEARLALGILERGVSNLILTKDALNEVAAIVKLAASNYEKIPLEKATVTSIRPVGLGHRVCVDTMSVLKFGQGMLTGNSSAFTFLVHAETEENSFVNSRPFRVNAGAVHAYAMMPNDRTSYLEELSPGDEVMIVGADGTCEKAVIGRVKVEVRPMLFIEAQTKDGKKGGVFLQNAETIRVVTADGKPVSVVNLEVGHEILCHLDSAGRHFGMRVTENIAEQ